MARRIIADRSGAETKRFQQVVVTRRSPWRGNLDLKAGTTNQSREALLGEMTLDHIELIFVLLMAIPREPENESHPADLARIERQGIQDGARRICYLKLIPDALESAAPVAGSFPCSHEAVVELNENLPV
jgi:hypothetical protein